MSPETPENVVRADDDMETIDGCLVNPDGEVVGLAEFDAIDEVVDEEVAQAMISRISAARGAILAVRVRRDAALRQFAAMEREPANRLSYLEMRFLPLLEAYAKRRLKHSKRRSFDLPSGRLGFRKTPGTAKILDMEKCTAFLRQIRREDLIETKIAEKADARAVAEVVDRWEGSDDVAPSQLDFLERTPPGDKFSLKTGILDD